MQPQNWSPVSGPEVHGANLLLLFAISKAILTLCVLAKRKVLGPVVLASHRKPFGLCENATYINAPHSGHNTQIHSSSNYQHLQMAAIFLRTYHCRLPDIIKAM